MNVAILIIDFSLDLHRGTKSRAVEILGQATVQLPLLKVQLRSILNELPDPGEVTVHQLNLHEAVDAALVEVAHEKPDILFTNVPCAFLSRYGSCVSPSLIDGASLDAEAETMGQVNTGGGADSTGSTSARMLAVETCTAFLQEHFTQWSKSAVSSLQNAFSLVNMLQESSRIVGLGSPSLLAGEWCALPPVKSELRRAVLGLPLMEFQEVHRPIAPKLVDAVDSLRAEAWQHWCAGEMEKAQKTAHSLKGVGMGFGVRQLEQAGKILEAAIAESDTASIVLQWTALDGCVAMLQAATQSVYP